MEQKTWPAFVSDDDEETKPRLQLADLTGWEAVVFELDDADVQDWESSFSTAALAP